MTETSVATTETTTTPKTPEPQAAAAGENVENGHGEAPAADTAETNGSAETKAEETPEVKEDPPKEMKSVVLLSFGGYKGVKVQKRPEPTPASGEVLIRVRSCGLNFQDLVTRLGAIDSPPKTPTILGFECSGEIEAIGEDVEGLSVGDRVVALPEFRAWAELCVVPAKYVYKLPEDVTFADAAAMTMNYLVAYIIVFDLLSLRPGKSVLLHSAAGGVGQAITQLIRTFDGVTLFGVCSKGKHEEINDGRFDHLIDRADYVNEIRKISPEGVDIVLDCLCGEDCNRGYGLLKPMGKYVLFGSSNVVTGETKSFFSVARSWWQVDKVSPIKLFDENKTFAGFNLRHFLYQQNGADYCRTVINNVFKLYSEGKVKPVVDSVWAFEDVTDAMQKMHDRKNIGKIILDPAAEPKPKPATPAKTKVKKDKKEKVQSPSTEEEKKIEDAAPAAEATKEAEQNGESKEDAAKPSENGSGDKEAENGKEDGKEEETKST